MGNSVKTIALDFLGCKLNQAEMEELGRELAAAGYCLVTSGEPADIYVLNTCTVTHVADRKGRQLLRQARRRNPAGKVIAIGCGAEKDCDELKRLTGADLVLGNARKSELVGLLQEEEKGPGKRDASTLPQERTRSFLKVQEGCGDKCAYCIVPLVRSRVSSVPAVEVIGKIKQLEAEGRREVVLTGTEIGTYADIGTDLKGLLERILAETGIERIRTSSLQPPEITRELVSLWKNTRLCAHFHLSLQSGSGAVLGRMKRRYSVEQYRRTMELIRAQVPDAAITTDVIAGFPGETEEEFAESLETCRKLGFARIHVFQYSPRPGTAAANMVGQVAEQVKKERSRKMMELGRESAREFQNGFLGRTMEVLFEQEAGGLWSGHTGNYIKVYVKSEQDLCNEILPVRVSGLYRDGVLGKAAK